MMMTSLKLGRRGFGALVAGAGLAAMLRPQALAAATGAEAIDAMAAALQGAKALSFTAEMDFGGAAASARLRTLGTRASVVFARPDSLFAVFGGGGEPDVQLLIAGGKANIYRLSLAARTELALDPAAGAAFAVPGVFVPFLALLADDVKAALFGDIRSVTPIAQGAPDQPETTTLTAVMGKSFTGEVWVDKATGFPARTTGTWFGAKQDVAASAAVNLSGWSTAAPDAAAFAPKGLTEAKAVELEALGL